MSTTAVVSSIISTLSIQDNKVTASSRDVAKAFGKQHRDVVRAIDLLDCSPDFTLRNFAQGYYTAPATGNQQHRFYSMTRDGFVFLAMGFTGKKAAQFKEAYIDAFNRMEAKLAAGQQQPRYAQPADQIPCKNSSLPLHLKRFLATVDEKGRINMREIDPGTYAVRFEDMPKLMADPGWGPLKEDKKIFERISRVAAARAVVGPNYAAELYREDMIRYQEELEDSVKKTDQPAQGGQAGAETASGPACAQTEGGQGKRNG